MTIALKISDVINEVNRDQFFTSILIDMESQSCTVNRTSVLTWGSEETSICSSTSYDELVVDGYDFTVLMDSFPNINISRYDDLAQAIYDVISLKGI
jgi:hypothetical protein